MRPWSRGHRTGAHTHQDGPGAESTPVVVPEVTSYVASPSSGLGPVLAGLAARHRCAGCSGADADYYDDPDTDVAPGIPASGRWSDLGCPNCDYDGPDPCPDCVEYGPHGNPCRHATDPTMIVGYVNPDGSGRGDWSELETIDATDPLLARALDGDR